MNVVWLGSVLIGWLAAWSGPIGDASGGVRAEEPKDPQRGAEIIRFRRVYAPADRLKDWPRDQVRYVPMEKTEFERLVGAAQAEVGLPPGLLPHHIVAARYLARLDGDRLLHGEAMLELDWPGPGPATVRLDPCSLAIHEASSLREKTQPVDRKGEPVILMSGPAGELDVRVQRPGSVRLNWSLQGRRVGGETSEFLLQLPACPSSRFVLLLPDGLAPVVDHALAAREGQESNESNHLVRWGFDLGGRTRVVLRIAPAEAIQRREQLSSVRQTATYEFSLRGLEVAAECILQIPEVPLRQMAVDLDAPLQLVSARCGPSALRWSSVASVQERNHTRVVLEFPEPIQGSERTVQLRAVAPLTLGSRWRLPLVRPRNLFWEEGTATLIVPAPLCLEQLDVSEGRQAQTGPLPGIRPGELAELQLFSPEAGIEVVLARRPSVPECDCGTSVTLEEGGLAAELRARLRLSDGEQFRLEATVAPLWIIDSVQTDPPDALDDWSVHPSDDGRAQLSLRLAKALSPSQPLRVVVHARHAASPLGRTLKRSDFVPIEFEEASSSRRLVAVRSVPAYQVRLFGPETIAQLKPNELLPEDLALLGFGPDAIVCLDDRRFASVQGSVQAQAATYSATVQVEAIATETGLAESYVLQIRPEGGRVDRLQVRFSRRRSVPLHWDFGPGEPEAASVRVVEETKPGTSDQAGPGETFEIVFRRARSAPFELRARRVVPLAHEQEISLACLPQAASQQGTVLIGSLGDWLTEIRTSGLVAAPPPPEPRDPSATVQAFYRYDPARDVAPASPASLRLILTKTASAVPRAWAWSAQAESRFEPRGSASHGITYWLENLGRDRVVATFPEGVPADAVRVVTVDGVQTAWELESQTPALRLCIPLPARARFSAVSIHWTTADRPWGIMRRVEPLVPKLDLPVMQSEWTLWLPPGYEAVGSGPQRWEGIGASRSIRERLFGPLARAAGSPRFRPWVAEDWRSGLGLESDLASARSRIEQFFQRLGGQEGRPNSPPGEAPGNQTLLHLDLGDRLAGAAADPELTVLVDRPGFARAGLTPRWRLNGDTASEASDRGRALAQQLGLALLFRTPVLVLTTQTEAALLRAQLVPLGSDSVWHVRAGPLAERIATAAQSASDPDLVPVERWASLPNETPDPWSWRSASQAALADPRVRQAYRIDLSEPIELSVLVVHQEGLNGAAWVLFVVVFAATRWGGRGRPAHLALLAGAWAVASLMLPEPLAPLASRGLWATLAAWVWPPRRPSPLPSQPEATPSTRRCTRASMASAEPVGMLIGLVAWAASGAAMSQPPQKANAQPGVPAYQVFIPVDENQQPLGDRYYVPEEFYARLHALSAGRLEQPHVWEIQSAVYRGSIRGASGAEPWALGELKAEFGLRVAGRQVRVRIPFGREGVEPLADSPTLDGRPVRATWPDPDGTLAFDVAEPGTYRFELAVRPRTETSDGTRWLRWQIPRVAMARLELAVPRDAPAIEFPSALGAVVRQEDENRYVVLLGPTDQLQIRWPQATSAAPPRVEVDQLLWLKFQPGSVVLDAQLHFQIRQGPVHAIELDADSRLRLFPAKLDRAGVAKVSTMPGEPQRIRLEFSSPIGDKRVLPLTFLLRNASGVGNYRLPRLEVVGAQVARRWLALSVDPILEHATHWAGEVRPLALPTFLATWGSSAAEPEGAWQLPHAHPDWSVRVRPVTVRTTAAQTIHWSFAPGSARVRLEAALSSSPGTVCQHRLKAPPELQIDQITLLQHGVEHVARWARQPDGTTVVFLARPVTGRQQATLLGRLPTPEQGRLPLPVVCWEAEAAQPTEVFVWREPAVRVHVEDVVGWTDLTPSAPKESSDPPARLVKALRAPTSGPTQANLLLAPNQPQIHAEQITAVRAESGMLLGHTVFRGRITEGVVDALRLHVPSAWPGPYQTDPPATVEAFDLPGQAQRLLVVRPHAAIEGEFRICVSSPLRLARTESPGIVPINAENLPVTQHHLVVPESLDGRPGRWESRGLAPSALPADPLVSQAEQGALIAFRGSQEPLELVWRPGPTAEASPSVLFANLRVACSVPRGLRGLASFALEPAGQNTCPLTLPDRYRLLQVFVGGLPTSAAQTGPNQWQIPLHSATLPQTIDVLFLAPEAAPHPATGLHVAWPRLGAVPIRQGVWAVAAPASVPLDPSDPNEQISPSQYAMAGLHGLTLMLERAAELPPVDREDLPRWYGAWEARWLAARSLLARSQALTQAFPDGPLASALQALDQRFATAAKRLGMSDRHDATRTTPRLSHDPDRIWTSLHDQHRAALIFGTARSAAPLVLIPQQRLGTQNAERIRWAMVLVGLSIATAWGFARGVFQRTGHAPRYLAVTLAGLFWWWTLRPSALGCILIATGLAGALWHAWHHRHKPASLHTSLPTP